MPSEELGIRPDILEINFNRIRYYEVAKMAYFPKSSSIVVTLTDKDGLFMPDIKVYISRKMQRVRLTSTRYAVQYKMHPTTERVLKAQIIAMAGLIHERLWISDIAGKTNPFFGLGVENG